MKLDVREVNNLRDRLRDLEAKLNATPKGVEGHYEVMAEVAKLRGVWRQAEVAIGRRAGGIGITIEGQPVDMSRARLHLPNQKVS